MGATIPLLFMVVDKMNFSGACAGILFYGVSSQVCVMCTKRNPSSII